MELSEPILATIINAQHQPQPYKQSEELGFHDEESTMTDQVQDPNVQTRDENADYNGIKEEEIDDDNSQVSWTIADQLKALAVQNLVEDGDCSAIKEEEIESDDTHVSWRSDVNGEQSYDKEINDRDCVNETMIENGERRDVEAIIGEKAERRETNRPNQFPIRPEAEDCSFYGRTGTCKFGMNCKFNHPPKRKPLSVKVKQKARDDSSDKTAQVTCKYYDQPGGCKYGKACKYNHNKHFELNKLGLPIRPGEKVCPYYVRNGSCKYESSCRFNHPDAVSSDMPDLLNVYSNGGPVALQGGPQSPLAPPWSPPATMNDIASYIPLFFPPTQGIPSSPEWNSYQAPFYPYESNMHISPAYTLNNPMLEVNMYAQRQQIPMAIDEFPKRPGQPPCSYFLRTGDCKYKSACKFHHPKSKVSISPACTLSDLGLPLRPGQRICSNYSRYGICKFGPACKKDHPQNYAQTDTLAAIEPGHSPSVGTSINVDDAIGVGT